jgi:hypothetical protein
MARKNFLSWVGFKEEGSALAPESTTTASTGAPASGVVDRIRELEAQLADLRSRKDITSLTREEFEILATETAMNLVKTAQSREKGASAQAAKLLAESSRIATEATAAAESKAKSILAAAESRGRKYLEVAESEGGEITANAQRTARSLTEAAKREAESLRTTTAQEIESMLASKKREAASIMAAAKSESEELVKGAISSITDYRTWLTSAVAESERLYKIQTQSLTAAQQAIEQSRQRLASAFERLAGLTEDIDRNLDDENQPITKEFVRGSAAQIARKESASQGEDSPQSAVKKAAAKRKAPVKKAVAKKSAAKSSQAKKSPAKKVSAKKSTRK